MNKFFKSASVVAVVSCLSIVGTIYAISPQETEAPLSKAPKVVTPGKTPQDAPSDAIVLFDGKNADEWEGTRGNKKFRWNIRDGAMETVRGAGYIQTKKSFGSCQLHIEWATPKIVKHNGQKRGNSGVFLMGKYEIQVLDSYNNRTYPNGQAGAVYKQYIPLVNCCKKPGEWQTYDIIFHRPIFDKGGNCIKQATFTVLQNGVLIQDHVKLSGPTVYIGYPKYKKHADKLPLSLQDHGDPVRYRNIWIRELKD